MKRLFLTLAGLWAIAILPGRVDAGRCKQRVVCNQHQQVQQSQQFAFTPFVTAVGIGVPVASPSYLQYQSGGQFGSSVGYNYVARERTVQRGYGQQQLLQAEPSPGCSSCQCQQKAAAAQQTLTIEQQRIAQLRAELARLEAGVGQVQQAPQASIISQACSRCHNTNPTAVGIVTDFSNPDALTCEQRLAAIGRILADDPAKRMPKGQQLPPEQIGLLIQALTVPPDVLPSPGPDPAPVPQAAEPGVPVPPMPK